jgi:2'-5' RNA ligase
MLRQQVEAAQRHLSDFLVFPYHRQPHVTLFACGFWVDSGCYDDDFSNEQYRAQLRALTTARLPVFSIEVDGLDSFQSAPYLAVRDPTGGLTQIRSVLSDVTCEIARSTYTPHVTLGLYSNAFPAATVLERFAVFPSSPVTVEVTHITFATYEARHIGGALRYHEAVALETSTLR